MSENPEKKRSKPLKKIKSGLFSRGFALAKVSLGVSARAASHAVSEVFNSDVEKKSERFENLLKSQIGLLTRELGQLKGSLMKVGQMLSVYGEHFLPPEANAVLKSLQSQSPPLEWPAIEKVLKRQLGVEKLAELEIQPVPLASASLGQVHKARRKSDGTWIALKVQYPGVDQAIEGDLRALKSLLVLSKMIPKGPKYEELFSEVRSMLHQEVDYRRELVATDEFRVALAGDRRFVVPMTFPEYSTARVLATSFEDGVALDSAEVLALSQERRNALGLAGLDVYLTELFRLRKVQTDPHFGNYRVRLGRDGEPDQLILLDFGAVREFSKKFLKSYFTMLRGAFELRPDIMNEGAGELGFIQEGDSPELRQIFYELCCLITEPFLPEGGPGVSRDFFDAQGAYDWGGSDLPKRVARKGAQMVFSFRLRTPPREVVFLDRKMTGMFVMLSVLKCRFQARELLGKYLQSATDPVS